MDKHFRVIDALAKRPGMYAGSTELHDVATFFNGYIHALLVTEELPDHAWNEWVGERYNIWHPAWSWERTLLHSLGSEALAISELPKIFRAYVADLRNIGASGIRARFKTRFCEDGEPLCYAQRVPETTFTDDPS